VRLRCSSHGMIILIVEIFPPHLFYRRYSQDSYGISSAIIDRPAPTSWRRTCRRRTRPSCVDWRRAEGSLQISNTNSIEAISV